MTTSPFTTLAAAFREARRHDPIPLRRWFAPWQRQAASGNIARLVLLRDETCTVTNVRDFPIRCLRGTLWVTWPESKGDAIVRTGERLVVSSRDKVVILALQQSTIDVPRDYAAHVTPTGSGRRIVMRRTR